MIEIKVKKHFDSFAIDAEFAAPDAGITVLAGASGAGKTTIINMIAGLVVPDEGIISVKGRVLFDSDKKINCPVNRRRCGYIFQDGRLFPNMSVKKNLLYGCKSKTPPLREIAELLGIEHLLNRMPAKLSGGEKQRVSIGRALLMEPDILLMDEPLASLDIARREELMAYIDKLPSQFNIPIFYVTHSAQEILRLSDELILIEKGRVAGTGLEEGAHGFLGEQTKSEAISTVYDCALKKFSEAENIVEASFGGGALVISSSIKPDDNFKAAVNADDVTIALDEPTRISASNIFQGRIVKIRDTGNGIIVVHGDIGGAEIVSCITKRSAARLNLNQGSQVYFIIKAVSVLK